MVVPTLQQLKNPATVAFQSTPRLADQARAKAKKIDDELLERGEQPPDWNRQLIPVAEAERSHGMSATPWQLLHTLARATVLAGHGSSRALAQHWSCLRYLMALQANNQGRLELSSDGNDPRYHRKAVQALDLGIAFGLTAAQHIMQQRHPDYRFDIADAELALEAGWALRNAGKEVRERTKVRPNYFLVGRKPGEPVRLVSVHCKGSHGREDAQHEQLAKAVPHAEAVILGDVDADGAPPPSLLIATGMLADGGIETRILGADSDAMLRIPDSTIPELTGPADQLNLPTLIPFTHPDGRQDSRFGFPLQKNKWEWFSRVLTRTAAASLLAFAGDRNSAKELLAKGQQYRLGSTHSRVSPGMLCDTKIALGGLTFVGTDHVFRLDGQRIEVFSGLFEDLHQRLQNHDFDGYERTLPKALADWSTQRSDIDQDWGEVTHVDSAGSLIAIRKEGSGRKRLL